MKTNLKIKELPKVSNKDLKLPNSISYYVYSVLNKFSSLVEFDDEILNLFEECKLEYKKEIDESRRCSGLPREVALIDQLGNNETFTKFASLIAEEITITFTINDILNNRYLIDTLNGIDTLGAKSDTERTIEYMLRNDILFINNKDLLNLSLVLDYIKDTFRMPKNCEYPEILDCIKSKVSESQTRGNDLIISADKLERLYRLLPKNIYADEEGENDRDKLVNFLKD